MNEQEKLRAQSFELQLQGQIVGINNHLRNIIQEHRSVEHATARAMGHLQEAIKICLKTRRFYSMISKGKK